MLKLADIKFPITFESRGIGHYIFTDEKTCHKVDLHSYKRAPSDMEIEHFIDAHNKHYNALKDYGYAMPGYTSFHYKPYKGQVLPVKENKQFLLDSEEIVYPITFETAGNSVVTFTSRDNGTYGNGLRTSYNVDYFVACHNMANPNNDKNKVYYVRDIERQWPKKDAQAEIPMVEMKTCDYKKLWCLSVDNIKYPITFYTVGNSTIRFTSRDNGVYSDGTKSELKVDFFVNGHNRYNPHNEEDKVYYVEDITKHLFGETPFGGGKKSIQKIIGEEIHKAAAEMKAPGGWRIDKSAFAYQEIVTQGAIEDMPVAATLKGVQLDDGTWYELTATPKTIEIHDDVVILLLHYGGAKNRTVAGEISIKRGTMVKWKVKV